MIKEWMKMKKLKQLLLVIVLSLSLTVPSTVPLAGSVTTVSAATVKPAISRKSISLYQGGTRQLKITGTSQKVKWSSQNTKIAVVNSKGKVTAKSSGKTTIIARVGNQIFRCQVTVKVKANSNPTTQASVWLSATGTKYHRIPNCGRMNPNRARKVSLSEARRRGYGPCQKCY